MKMVKSLLLGSAAGLAVVSGAAAADLPVKAKPVQYVKICSLYGDGYFYIPGTDTCIKLGGAVRVQYDFNGTGGVPVGFNNTLGFYNRAQYAPTNFRNRIYFSVDARQQTEYGTLRTYFRFGTQQTTSADAPGGAVFWDRAFTQFAGFTVGKTVSYYDPFGTGDLMYNTTRVTGDSAAVGVGVVAYTAQFGGGVSATVSIEDPNLRGRTLTDLGGASLGGAFATDVGFTAGASGFRYPDLVGNIRIDQAWGSAQVNAGIRDVTNNVTGLPLSDTGWAVGAGVSINLPGWGARGIAQGQPNVDQFRIQANYCEGAGGYCGPSTANNGFNAIQRGTSLTLGFSPDGIIAPPVGGAVADIQLTTAWSMFAAYQHIWTPTLRTSLYGGVLSYEFNDAATLALCPGGPGAAGAAFGGAITRGAGFTCDPDFRVWQVGSRTQWNPVSQLDLGVDFLYTQLDTNSSGPITAAAGAVTAPTTFDGEQGTFSVHVRAQRNFWP